MPPVPGRARMAATPRRAALWCLLLAGSAFAAPAPLPTTQRIPVVEGAPETRSTPFIAWFMDLSAAAYVEEEYAVSGTADIYGYVDEASQSPAVETIEAGAPYTTRILVRRPLDPGKFNGTVFYEVLNATAGWDGDPIWQGTFEYIMREGAAWVGITTKPVTVEFLRDGWAASPRVTRNASRYANLAMPHFGQVWDMLAQTARLLRTPASPDHPLAGFEVERLIMVGYSQSAAYQVTFANSFHAATVMADGAPVIDGYYISAGGAGAKHVTGPTDTTPEHLPVDDPRNLLLTPVPTIRFQTQTEVVGFPSYPVRQSELDAPWLRFYEMAGGSHVDERINEVGGQALVRDLGLPPSFCPSPAVPYNPILIGHVQSALLAALEAWIAEGTPPPASRFLELDRSGPVRIVLDGDGNAVGGVRPPQVEVPLGAYLPNNSGPGFCFLYGGFEPFDEGELRDRYPRHDRYVNAFTRAVDRARKEGFLLRQEADGLKQQAATGDLGR